VTRAFRTLRFRPLSRRRDGLTQPPQGLRI
jgi:hypothetical protein